MTRSFHESAALEALSAALYDQRQRLAGDDASPYPWYDQRVSREVRDAYRHHALRMVEERQALDNPAPNFRMISPWEAQVRCLLAEQNPNSYVDAKDFRAGKENWVYFKSEMPYGWALKASEVTRALDIAAANLWKVSIGPYPDSIDYAFAPENDDQAVDEGKSVSSTDGAATAEQA